MNLDITSSDLQSLEDVMELAGLGTLDATGKAKFRRLARDRAAREGLRAKRVQREQRNRLYRDMLVNHIAGPHRLTAHPLVRAVVEEAELHGLDGLDGWGKLRKKLSSVVKKVVAVPLALAVPTKKNIVNAKSSVLTGAAIGAAMASGQPQAAMQAAKGFISSASSAPAAAPVAAYAEPAAPIEGEYIAAGQQSAAELQQQKAALLSRVLENMKAHPVAWGVGGVATAGALYFVFRPRRSVSYGN